MKTERRIYIILILIGMLLGYFQLIRLDSLIQSASGQAMVSPFLAKPATALSRTEVSLLEQKRALVIATGDLARTENIKVTLNSLNFVVDILPAATQSRNYQIYDLIALLSSGVTELADPESLYAYTRDGGCLVYLANGSSKEDLLFSQAGFWGINHSGSVEETNSVYFSTELLSGISGSLEFTGEYIAPFPFFESLDVDITPDCKVHLESGTGNPLIWEKQVINGRLMVVNTGRYERKEIRGLLAGAVSQLLDILVYPVIGSKVICIDDFPADYRSTNEILRTGYGRDFQRYILELWWPQMRKLGNHFGLKFTGSFVAGYSDQVTAPFVADEEICLSTISLVNDLLTDGGEVTLHGFNHQPLSLNQLRMQEYGYTAWPDQNQIAAALQQTTAFFSNMYPKYTFFSYIPPSDLLEPEALPPLLESVPSIKVISSAYYDNGNSAFIQEFGLDGRYGIALPKVTSGAFMTDEVRFLIASTATTDGIINHVVYPDEIFDAYRSKSLRWEQLVPEYERLFGEMVTKYSWLSSDTVSTAAAKLALIRQATVYYENSNGRLKLVCDHFSDQISVMVVSKQPLRAVSGCSVQAVDSIRYLVSLQEAQALLEVVQP